MCACIATVQPPRNILSLKSKPPHFHCIEHMNQMLKTLYWRTTLDQHLHYYKLSMKYSIITCKLNNRIWKKRSMDHNKKYRNKWPTWTIQSLTRNIATYPLYMHHPILATVITQSQMHVQIKHSLAHLEDLIPTLAGIKYKCKTNLPK